MRPPDSVLLIHGGALGDFVLSLSIVRTLRLRGASPITVLARGAHQWLALHGGASRFLNLERSPWHLLFSDGPTDRFPGELSSIDLAIDMLGGPNLACNLARLGVKRVVSIDPRPRTELSGHITDQWAGDLASRGIDLRPLVEPRIETPVRFRRSASVLIHPGSGSAVKCWPLSRYLQLAELLRGEGLSPGFIVGPVETETWPPDRIAEIERMGTLLRNLPLETLSDNLASAELYIGNDSGVSHLAAALETPTLVVFGTTSAERWRPLGNNVDTIESDGWPMTTEVMERCSQILDRQALGGRS